MDKNTPPKVQFLAIRSQVAELIEKGYSYSQTYKIFVDEGKLTMSYSSFLRYVLGRNQKKSSNDVRLMAKPEVKKIASEKQSFGKKNFNSEENI